MLRAVVCLLCLLPFFARAQTAPKPDGQWRGALGVGVTATSGNTDSQTYSINGDVVRQTPSDKITGYVQSVYGKRTLDDGTTERISDQARAGAAYARDVKDERVFAFGAADWDRNPLIDLQLRSVYSAGVGYHLVKRENLTFDVSTGPAYNRERFTTETRVVTEWLLAEESTHALKSGGISFKQRLAYYINLEEGGEYRVVFDAGLVFKISSRWNGTMTVNTRYQSNPLPGVEKQDTLFVTGLQYVFNPAARTDSAP